MAKFKFRLATFLRVRESLRQDRRRELGEAYAADAILQGQEESAREELAATQLHCRRTAGPGGVDVDRLIEAQRYEIELRSRLQQLAQRRELLAAEVERRRQAVVSANRDVRVLEQLRQRQEERYRHEDNLRQVKTLDEAAQHRMLEEETA